MAIKCFNSITVLMNNFDQEKNDFDDDDGTDNKRYFVTPTSRRLIVKRNGSSITRRIPKSVVPVDTREQSPFNFIRFSNWIGDPKKHKLTVGDYSVEGMENLLTIERKSFSDLITTLMQQRPGFFKLCEKMTQYKWRALFVEASYEDIKSPYGDYTMAHPNAVSGTLEALEVKFGIPVIDTSQY